MWWYQGMWYLSRESQSTKLRQPTSKSLELCTIRSQYYQDHLQKPKSHNDSYLRLRHRNTQIGNNWKNQNQSARRLYWNNPRPRRTNLKNQHLAGRHKGPRRDQTKA